MSAASGRAGGQADRLDRQTRQGKSVSIGWMTRRCCCCCCWLSLPTLHPACSKSLEKRREKEKLGRGRDRAKHLGPDYVTPFNLPLSLSFSLSLSLSPPSLSLTHMPLSQAASFFLWAYRRCVRETEREWVSESVGERERERERESNKFMHKSELKSEKT
jgi:hypothetical protein